MLLIILISITVFLFFILIKLHIEFYNEIFNDNRKKSMKDKMCDDQENVNDK